MPTTATAPRILVVEDDPDFQRLLESVLAREGMAHVGAVNFSAACRTFDGAPPGTIDLILLDLGLPDADGFALLRRLRELGKDVPVIVVSAEEDIDRKVLALSNGADDYIVKPCRIDEITARIRAVLRRRGGPTTLEIGELRLDRTKRRAERAGEPIDLSPREFDLLVVLAEAKGRTLSREELLTKVWDERFSSETNVLDVHLGRLRRKLDRNGRPAIKTVRGQGYCLALENVSADH